MTHLEAAEIEEVSSSMLGRLIRDTRNIVVIFCKYIAYAIIALTHTCYLIKNYAPDELKKFLPPQSVRGMASETWLPCTKNFETWVPCHIKFSVILVFPFSQLPCIFKLEFDQHRCFIQYLHISLGIKEEAGGGGMFVIHSFIISATFTQQPRHKVFSFFDWCLRNYFCFVTNTMIVKFCVPADFKRIILSFEPFLIFYHKKCFKYSLIIALTL